MKLYLKSIDESILEQKFIDKWDGHMPTVTGGSNNMMDISSLMNQINE